MSLKIDDSIPERKVVVSENKSGARTVNGKSTRQLLYNYRRKYGEEAYQEMLKRTNDGKLNAKKLEPNK